MTFCEQTAGNGASFQTHGRTNGWTDRGHCDVHGQTDVEVEIVT